MLSSKDKERVCDLSDLEVVYAGIEEKDLKMIIKNLVQYVKPKQKIELLFEGMSDDDKVLCLNVCLSSNLEIKKDSIVDLSSISSNLVGIKYISLYNDKLFLYVNTNMKLRWGK